MQSMHALCNLIAYIFNKKSMHVLTSAWGQPVPHSTRYTTCMCCRVSMYVLWRPVAIKALPLNTEHRAHHFIQRVGGPYAFLKCNKFDVQATCETVSLQKPYIMISICWISLTHECL